MIWFRLRLIVNRVRVFLEGISGRRPTLPCRQAAPDRQASPGWQVATDRRDFSFQQKILDRPGIAGLRFAPGQRVSGERLRRRVPPVAVAAIILSLVLAYSVFGLLRGVPLRGISASECLVHFDDSQIERFKKAALRLDRLPGLAVDLHTISRKENFWKVASSNRININTIIGANPWLPDLQARLGKEIIVLDRRGVLHLVRRGENLAAIANLYRVPVGVIRSENGIFFLAGVRPGTVVFVPGVAPKLMTPRVNEFFQKRKIFISPASGKYTSGFGWREHPVTHARNFHAGLDIRARYGSLVWAAAAGTVVVSGPVQGYGNLVVIQHPSGFTTYYAHNSSLLVHSGQRVHKGQPIARAGNSGTSTGTHVHFEVRKSGKPDDPATYLW